jgi:microsomal dipeptidase-like Zn-dependent dipeptidase
MLRELLKLICFQFLFVMKNFEENRKKNIKRSQMVPNMVKLKLSSKTIFVRFIGFNLPCGLIIIFISHLMIPIWRQKKNKHHQQIKVIRHAMGIFLYSHVVFSTDFVFLMAARGIKTIKKSFYMARLSGKKKSY